MLLGVEKNKGRQCVTDGNGHKNSHISEFRLSHFLKTRDYFLSQEFTRNLSEWAVEKVKVIDFAWGD